MGEHGLVSERARSRREFSRRMESLRQEANSPQQLQPIRRGWKLGGEDRAGQGVEDRAGGTRETGLDQGGAEAAAQGR